MLAELKGIAASIPNQGILINTLGLQEAKDSSEIENIVTTHDELFKDDVLPEAFANPAAKEVLRYRQALRLGYEQVRATGLMTTNHIIAIQAELERNNAGLRKLPGTALKNAGGETVYLPPQHPDEIVTLMRDLERFINESEIFAVDPLIKMALIHHQFESIHPFYDGNGRTGRILNVLYLVKEGLLDVPVLYLSSHIVRKNGCSICWRPSNTQQRKPSPRFMRSNLPCSTTSTAYVLTSSFTARISSTICLPTHIPKLSSYNEI